MDPASSLSGPSLGVVFFLSLLFLLFFVLVILVQSSLDTLHRLLHSLAARHFLEGGLRKGNGRECIAAKLTVLALFLIFVLFFLDVVKDLVRTDGPAPLVQGLFGRCIIFFLIIIL